MDIKWNKKKMVSIVLVAAMVLSALVVVMPTMAEDVEADLKVVEPSIFALDRSITSAEGFVGTWTNADLESRGMIKFVITQEDSEYYFHGYAACHPTPCDWGTTSLTLYSKSINDTNDIAGTAEYDSGFKETRIYLLMLNSYVIIAYKFDKFTDASGRHNYASMECFTKDVVPEFTTPTQLSPADGSVFDHYPRTTTLKWTAVPGATSYTVEYAYKFGNTWTSYTPESGITGTSYTFDFVGAQPGRWRVWAVDAFGQESPKTGWWEFRYTT